jgi:hypothetical protein
VNSQPECASIKPKNEGLLEGGLWAPSGHPDRCLVCIILILRCRAWSKLDVQVVVCNWVGDPFKAWVAGSNPAALTKNAFLFIGLHHSGVLPGDSAPTNPLLSNQRTCAACT